MDQVDQIRKSYHATLSSAQKKLLRAVEKDTLAEVKIHFARLSQEKIQEKQLDYILLTTAIKRHHQSITQFLLKSGCRTQIEGKTKFHCVPLYYAFERNFSSIAAVLIKKGASIYDTDLNEESPLQFALQNNKFRLIDTILYNLKWILGSRSLNPNSESDVALFHLACYRNFTKAVQKFLKCGFSVNSRSNFDKEEWGGFTPLHFAVKTGRNPSISYLLQRDVDFFLQDHKGMTAVHLIFRERYTAHSFSPLDSELVQKWASGIIDRDFSNPVDQNGLSHFHIICCGVLGSEISKHLKTVQFFIDNEVDINRSVSLEDENYPAYTALHFAVRNLQFDVAKVLLENGADFTKTTKEGLSPLHVVGNSLWNRPSLYRYDNGISSDEQSKGLEIIKLLLEHGADVDAEDLKGGTLLHYAFYNSKGRDDPLVRFLVSKSQLSSNLTDSFGLSYLHIASSTNLSAVKTLMENGVPQHSYLQPGAPFKHGYSVLHFAVSSNKLEIVQYLLEQGLDPNDRVEDERRTTALHIACAYSLFEFHDFEVWISREDARATLQSYQEDKIHIVQSLLKKGAAINEKDSSGASPLSEACQISAVPYQIHDTEESNKFMEQLHTGQLELIELLLRNGADVATRSNDGESILHKIVRARNSPLRILLAELILKKGADPNVADEKGLTPLHVLVLVAQSRAQSRRGSSNLPLLTLLCENGADINARSSNSYSLLHFAVDHACHEILGYILNRPDIDLNVQNDSGNTPLHVAALHMNLKWLVKLLLNAGSDINIENLSGQPPLSESCRMLVENFEDFQEHSSEYIMLLLKHFRKLQRINAFISERVRNDFDAFLKLTIEENITVDYAIDEELEKLKSVMIDPFTSLRKILLKDANDMVNHVKNEELKKIIASPELRNDFPIFYGILYQQFRAGSRRSSILEPAKQALEDVLQVSLPDSCTEHILKYFSDENLKDLIKLKFAPSSRKRCRQNSSSLGVSETKVQRLE